MRVLCSDGKSLMRAMYVVAPSVSVAMQGFCKASVVHRCVCMATERVRGKPAFAACEMWRVGGVVRRVRTVWTIIVSALLVAPLWRRRCGN